MTPHAIAKNSVSIRSAGKQPLDLVILPFNDYRKGEQQGFRDRENHLIETLLKRPGEYGRVLIIDRPVSVLESLARRRSWRVTDGRVVADAMNWQLAALASNVHVLSCRMPAVLGPALRGRTWWHHAYQSERFGRLVAQAIRHVGMVDPVVLAHHPFAIELVRCFPHRGLVFDAIDNFLKIDHFAPLIGAMREQYRRIESTADAIITVTTSARDNLFPRRGDVAVIGNGVDPSHFRHPPAEHGIERLQVTGRLKVGYAGTLAARIDVPLLTALARQLPDVDFFLVGPVVNPRGFKPLRALPNVVFPGNQHYRNLPSILRDFDICMIPHAVGRYENDGDAIKFYEYIAAGKPVVSTRVLGVERFANYFLVADDAQQFREAIGQWRARSCRPDYPENLLDGHTWDDKLRAYRDVLEGVRA